jgi:hypothetical protein
MGISLLLFSTTEFTENTEKTLISLRLCGEIKKARGRWPPRFGVSVRATSTSSGKSGRGTVAKKVEVRKPAN